LRVDGGVAAAGGEDTRESARPPQRGNGRPGRHPRRAADRHPGVPARHDDAGVDGHRPRGPPRPRRLAVRRHLHPHAPGDALPDRRTPRPRGRLARHPGGRPVGLRTVLGPVHRPADDPHGPHGVRAGHRGPLESGTRPSPCGAGGCPRTARAGAPAGPDAAPARGAHPENTRAGTRGADRRPAGPRTRRAGGGHGRAGRGPRRARTRPRHERPPPRTPEPDPAAPTAALPAPEPAEPVAATAAPTAAPVNGWDTSRAGSTVHYGPAHTRHTTAAQAVRDAEGPVLVLTSHPALWEETKDARGKLGPTHLYDPTHRCDTPARLHWSPTSGCEDKATATARAAALLAPVRPASRLDQAVSDTAELLLRSYVHEAAVDGRTVRHVHRGAQGLQVQDAVRVLRTSPKAAPGAAGELEAALTAHPERRDMAQQLTARALSALSTVNVREACTPNRNDAL